MNASRFGAKTGRFLAILVVSVMTIAFSERAHAIDVYKFDHTHTEVFFGWNHAGVAMQHGEFTKTRGALYLDPDNVENSRIKVRISANSLSTGVPALDVKLKGSGYFDIEKFPYVKFTSTSVKRTGDTTADVTGNLTIRDVTKPATLKVVMTHKGTHPTAQYIESYKGSWIAFSAETTIKQLDFGVGSYAVGPLGEIKVRIHTEMQHKPKRGSNSG